MVLVALCVCLFWDYVGMRGVQVLTLRLYLFHSHCSLGKMRSFNINPQISILKMEYQVYCVVLDSFLKKVTSLAYNF